MNAQPQKSLIEMAGAIPSRTFFVQQATLNAAYREFPAFCLQDGPARALKWAHGLWGDQVPGYFQAAVCREFQALGARYNTLVSA